MQHTACHLKGSKFRILVYVSNSFVNRKIYQGYVPIRIKHLLHSSAMRRIVISHADLCNVLYIAIMHVNRHYFLSSAMKFMHGQYNYTSKLLQFPVIIRCPALLLCPHQLLSSSTSILLVHKLKCISHSLIMVYNLLYAWVS